jgi:hypothetical protein
MESGERRALSLTEDKRQGFKFELQGMDIHQASQHSVC